MILELKRIVEVGINCNFLSKVHADAIFPMKVHAEKYNNEITENLTKGKCLKYSIKEVIIRN